MSGHGSYHKAKTDRKHHYYYLKVYDEKGRFAKNLVDEALQALEHFDKKADPLRALATYIIDRKR